MGRYILRRLLEAVPTIGGVLLLTFVLFHVVGGSPASLALGQHANARALEAYDRQHGYDKPLLMGWWTSTRAWDPAPLASHPRVLTSGEQWAIPLAFPLRAHTRYRWTLTYRLPPPGRAELRMTGAAQPAIPLLASETPRTLRWIVETGEAPVAAEYAILAGEGVLTVEAVKLERRMPHPLDSQFVHFLRRLAVFDFGVSSESGLRVADILRAGLVPSLCLTVPILVGGCVLALGLGLLCAATRNRLTDRALVLAATGLMSVNYIVWVVVGQYLFAFRFGWFPIWGFESWAYLLLPVSIGMVSGLGRDVRLYRTFLLDEMHRDYVRAARARGLSFPAVLFRHVLRNAWIPIVTNISLSVPYLFTGSLLLESAFGIPGLGNVSVNAIHAADLPVIRAVVVIGALIYVMVNMLTDVLYAALDPRVRLSGRGES